MTCNAVTQVTQTSLFKCIYSGIILQMNRWADYYTNRAKKEDWRARSVYKLQEIDRRVRLIHSGDRILDLGCYPGSWSQYCLRKVRTKGHVTGVDILEPERLGAKNFQFIKADVLQLDLEWLRKRIGLQDVLLSDMAPKTTGISVTDVARSLKLAYKALDVASYLLKWGGNFLCKVFEGEGFADFRHEISSAFSTIRLVRPDSTRKRSREIYVAGLGFKK